MIKPAIVVIAYDRADSLKRLLGSLDGAFYPKDCGVDLIISIDKGNNGDVIRESESFDWKYGEKRIIKHETNLGLKAHVLECGDHVHEYGSLIMLEDDLMVSGDFYNYVSAALEFTRDDEKVGGISLYDHLLNVHVREPFYALDDGYDNYYLQFASSWGQAYTEKMWSGFRSWLKVMDGKDISGINMPENVSGWSEKSWLKYNIRYLIDKDMYFLYPRVSHTTNFYEAGEHSKEQLSDLQVPLQYGRKEGYRFSRIEGSRAVYDAFFENISLTKTVNWLNCAENEDCIIDLYGSKKIDNTRNEKRALSSQSLGYSVIKSFGRVLRPIEANIISEISGKDFFLYDLERTGTPPKTERVKKYLYNYRTIRVNEMIQIIKYRFKKR